MSIAYNSYNNRTALFFESLHSICATSNYKFDFIHFGCVGSSRARKDSVMEISERTLGMVINKLSPADDERPTNWKGSGSLSKNLIISSKEPYVVLGPGQIQPKGYRLTSGRYGELKLGLLKIKGTIEVEVSEGDL